MLVVVVGGFWIKHELEQAKDERCQLAFGQVKLLTAELQALQPVTTLTAEEQAGIKADVQQAVAWVVQECGAVPE